MTRVSRPYRKSVKNGSRLVDCLIAANNPFYRYKDLDKKKSWCFSVNKGKNKIYITRFSVGYRVVVADSTTN
jgi:hypothetical protein